MDDFTKTKLTFAVALLALLFAVWPLIASSAGASFVLFGITISLRTCYTGVVIALSASVYASGWRLLTQTDNRWLALAADAAYACALVLPPAAASLFGVSIVADWLSQFSLGPGAIQVVTNLASAVAGAVGALAGYRLWWRLRERSERELRDGREAEVIDAFSRAKSLFAQGHYDLAVLDAYRAVEAATRRRLQELGLADRSPAVRSVARVAGEALALSESEMAELQQVSHLRHLVAHSNQPLTESQARDSLKATERLLARLSSAQRAADSVAQRGSADTVEAEVRRKLRVWLKPDGLGGPGEVIPDYLFSSSTYGEVAVSAVEQAIMLERGWIELVDGNSIRITKAGQAAASQTGTPMGSSLSAS